MESRFMDKPVILAVDDEPAVLSAVARDLRRQYGNDYRIVRADSGGAALDALQQLKLKADDVALLIADQRMPAMSGVDFLHSAMELYPEAKRVLLTAYADTEAAIKAINEVQLDHYLMKPWDPPEERLYPTVDELLDDWQSAITRSYEGIQIIGHRWSASSYEVKDFLSRNLVPYHWIDVEADPDAEELLRLAGADGKTLPVVIFEDGTVAVAPSTTEVAERLGRRTSASLPTYDLVVVGGGPAGLGAAVYGASEGLSTLLVESDTTGGQAVTSSKIENYLGFPGGISGGDLMRRARDQAERFGTEVLITKAASGIELRDPYRVVKLSDGTEVICKALVIASGVQYRKLEADGVDRLLDAGVYYGGATTEGKNFSGEDVFIVGGGNSAGQAAMYLAGFARSVTILIRGEALGATMSQYLVDRIEEAPNVHVRPTVQVAAVDGEDRLESVTLENIKTGERETVPAGALFIFIGAMPRTDWVDGVVLRDRYGFILTGPEVMPDGHRPKDWWTDRDPFWLESSVPGIFVAGDVRSKSIKRVASAVGEGAMAVSLVHQHLAEL
jgi:thioredoxin reductase (NADPH)